MYGKVVLEFCILPHRSKGLPMTVQQTWLSKRAELLFNARILKLPRLEVV
jgi:hypothetical protein